MPNWCSNNFSITGPKEKIRALWDQAQKDEESGGGLLTGMRPMPEFKEPVPCPITGKVDATMPDWWNWRVANWGTKWEVSTEGMQYTEDGDTATIAGWFESAWSPPVEAFAFYCDEQDDVSAKLSYYEPGMCFVGEWTSDGGDECIEYNEFTSKTVREGIGEYLDDMWGISESMAEWEEENEEENDDA